MIGNLSWSSVEGLSDFRFSAVAVDPSNPGVAYAGGSGTSLNCNSANKVAGCDVYQTIDGGSTWNPVTATVDRIDIRSLAVNGQNVYAVSRDVGDGDKVLRSPNGGTSWEAVTGGTGVGDQNKAMMIDPNNSNVIYVGNFQLASKGATDSFVIKSTDGGTNWVHLPNPNIASADLRADAITFDSAGAVYAGGSGTPNVAKSNDGGATWTDIRITGLSVFVHSLAIDPTNRSILYAGTLTQGVYKSIDGGASWAKKNIGLPDPPPEVRALLIDPANPKYIHAGTSKGYYYTLDGGETWISGNSGSMTNAVTVYGLALTPSCRLIAATSNGLFLLDLSADPPTAANSDLELSSSVTPNSISTGENLTYQLKVTNKRPDAATSVVVTMTLSAGSSFVSATPQGTCQGASTITCNLGVIDNGANAVVTIVVTPSVAGNLSQDAAVSTGATDPNGANNSVSMSATVNSASSGGGGGGAGALPVDTGDGGSGGAGGTSGNGEGGGGGGCAMGRDGAVDVMLAGLFCFGLAALVRRWKISRKACK